MVDLVNLTCCRIIGKIFSCGLPTYLAKYKPRNRTSLPQNHTSNLCYSIDSINPIENEDIRMIPVRHYNWCKYISQTNSQLVFVDNRVDVVCELNKLISGLMVSSCINGERNKQRTDIRIAVKLP